MPPNNKLPKNISSITSITILVSISIWVAAACLPAYLPHSSNDSPVIGISCFIMGFFAVVFMPHYGIIWVANIFGFLGFRMLLQKRYYKAIKRSLVAAALSACSLIVHQLPRNENGGTIEVSPGPGAFLWIGSMVVILAGSYLALQADRRQTFNFGNTNSAPSSSMASTTKKHTLSVRTLTITIVILVISFIVIGIIDTLASFR